MQPVGPIIETIANPIASPIVNPIANPIVSPIANPDAIPTEVASVNPMRKPVILPLQLEVPPLQLSPPSQTFSLSESSAGAKEFIISTTNATADTGLIISSVATTAEMEPIGITCQNGHRRVLFNNLDTGCLICTMLAKLKTASRKVVCSQTEYFVGQTRFEFKCQFGHRFMAGIRDCNFGCRSCNLLFIAMNYGSNITLDTKCLYLHDHVKLRFHCNKLRHNPKCQNPACLKYMHKTAHDWKCDPKWVYYDKNCRDFIPCDQDFYATPYQLKSRWWALLCDYNHRWQEDMCIFTCIRSFEHLYGDRFDDDAYTAGIEFTGYNARLKIAFTHELDAIPAKCARRALNWCMQNSVNFIIVPKNITKTSTVCVYIINTLASFNLLCGNDANDVLSKLRKDMHDGEREGKILARRF